MDSRPLTILLVLALLAAPLPVSAAEDPRFETTVPEPTLEPGTTRQLAVVLVNDDEDVGDRVDTAFDVEVTAVSGDTPIEVRSGPRSLGAMQDGAAREVRFTIDVPADIESGAYRIPLRVAYEHDADAKTQTTYATVRVEDRARFVVESTAANVPVAGSGTLSVTMTNVGSEPANRSSVTLSSSTPDVRFGSAASASRYVGGWAPGETRTVDFDVSVADGAAPRSYALEATVAYEDPGGNDVTSRPLTLGVTPLPELTFVAEEVESTLRVGWEGTLSGELVNGGETTARDVVLIFESANPNVNAVETEYAVGTLRPGQRVPFSFDVEVSDAAQAGPRKFTLVAEYRGHDGEARRADPVDLRVRVGERRDEFRVGVVNGTFAAGESGRLELTVTNERDETVRDVSAKLFVDAPVAASDDEAFIEELKPGESETIVFGVGVGGEALAKTYPVKLDFRYDTAEGETRISDTYLVPVEVTERQGGGLALPALLGVVLVVALGGGYLYRSRRG
jgi:hypothetical protein